MINVRHVFFPEKNNSTIGHGSRGHFKPLNVVQGLAMKLQLTQNGNLQTPWKQKRGESLHKTGKKDAIIHPVKKKWVTYECQN